jgi:hypothetical protein
LKGLVGIYLFDIPSSLSPLNEIAWKFFNLIDEFEAADQL